MVDLLPLLEALGTLLQLLDESFVLALVVLDVAGEGVEAVLLGVEGEAEFVELLAAVVGDVAVDLGLELL